jgi:HlyD family secretion protein
MTFRVSALPLAAACALGGCAEEAVPAAPRVSGYVEATEIQVSADTSGRLIELRVSEGDRVTAGDTIGRLDARDAELQIARAKAERLVTQAQLRLLEAGPRDEDVRQAEAQAQAAAVDVSQTDAELAAAELELRRFEGLLAAEAGSVKQRDDARARVDIARERRRSVLERVEVARRALTRAKSGARREEIDTARARIGVVDAQIAALEKTVADASFVSPVTGVVTQGLIDAGEIVARGTPILVVTDLDHAWANLFVPEPLVPTLRLGQPATIFTDAGGPGLAGTITYVSPRAEFTPRNTQTVEERSRLVYRIKVGVDNRAGTLKPGMPVDAELAAP